LFSIYINCQHLAGNVHINRLHQLALAKKANIKGEIQMQATKTISKTIDLQDFEPIDIVSDEMPSGIDLLHDPMLNQGTAFTEEERERFGLRGFLPPRVITQEAQAQRVMENFHKKPGNLEKYVYMIDLEDRNENLFYRVVMDNIETMMPIIYTPTVGKACQEFGHIFRRPRGFYISLEDRGRIAEILSRWPYEDVRIIVVTDGERILGLGDLGVNGMGIPVGKLSLYTACAGIHPSHTLPITLDVGTNNRTLLEDPLYLGHLHPRVTGQEYDDFIDEFVDAVIDRFPKAVIQFEDFANHNAFRLLKKYRNRICTFNDDIQGTGSVALAGLLSALRITGGLLKDHKFLFLGAGEAGIGIGNIVVSQLMAEGASEVEARQACWFFDINGLITAGREDLADHHLPFAHEHEAVSVFLDAVKEVKPTAIIGACGQAKLFCKNVIEEMARLNERPIILALSNPTSKSECTAENAYTWSDGRVIFASGSPFPPVTLPDGRTFVPGQSNNSYVFPGIGLGVSTVGAKRITDSMFLAAARALAQEVTEADLALGRIYPPLTKIREVSAFIAVAVAKVAYDEDLATAPRPYNLLAYIKEHMYQPNYLSFV
jgi:malate dehydrogenase (oxaloacetate-decarboxylating)(NADP+)